jgi:hypothetical protein
MISRFRFEQDYGSCISYEDGHTRRECLPYFRDALRAASQMRWFAREEAPPVPQTFMEKVGTLAFSRLGW